MERRRLRRSGLIAGGATLFGAAGCLAPTTAGTNATADASADAPGDATGGDTATADTPTVDIARPDTRPDSSSDSTACWEPPANLQDLLGRPCREEWNGKGICRDDTTLVMKCVAGEWLRADAPGDDLCWCDAPVDCAPEDYICAAVGYVGVTRASTTRPDGQPLRKLA